MAIKFHEACKIPTTTEKMWEKLIKFRDVLVLNDENIEELCKGLELGRLLELPNRLAFNSLRLHDFLAHHKMVRPFSQSE